MKTELPEDIKKLVEERTNLDLELGGLRMVNTYGQSLEFLIEMNSREIMALRRLTEINSKIDSYIRSGKPTETGMPGSKELTQHEPI